MRRMVGVIVVMATVLILMAGSVLAVGDEVILKTGMVLEGKILERTDTGIRIHVIGLGKMNVTWDKIRSVNGKDVEPPEPEVPEPTPATPDGTKEPEKPVEAVPTEPEKPAEEPVEPNAEPEPVVSRVDVPYSELKKGQTLLFVFRGEDHGDWRESGLRVVAEIGLVGKKRLKIIMDPSAGILGEKWVKKEDLSRAIRLDDRPDRRLLFFSDGVESGSWIRGTTADGRKFEGQLGGVTSEGSMTVWMPEEDRVDKIDVSLVELKTISAITRSKKLHLRMDGLIAGEPIEISVFGRDEPVVGRVKTVDRRWFTLSTGDPREGTTGEVHFFRGLPVIGMKLLPETVRGAIGDVTPQTWLTVDVETEDEEATRRRSATGRFVHVTLKEISIETTEGVESIPVATVQGIVVPATERLPALTAKLDTSSAETLLAVYPGMTRKEVERRLPPGTEGIDLIYDDDDRVSTVYCRSPFTGPVFGIRIGSLLREALARTDLVFDLQIDPKDQESEPVTTVVSHTLKPYLVKLLVAKSGEVLAAEITKR